MFTGKVLIPIDFSKTSEKLCDSIIELKNLGINEVILTHVIENSYIGIKPHKLKKYYEERLFSIKQVVDSSIDKVSIKVQIGRGSREILKLANTEEVSLILIASHGRGLIRNFFLGRTVYNVVRKSKKPILVEKFENLEKEKEENIQIARVKKFNKILVPTDFSKYAEEVFNKVKKIPTHPEEIIITSIIESNKDLTEQEISISEKLDHLKETLDKENICDKVSTITRQGTASREIINLAQEIKVGIIIMATRGKGYFKNLPIGSTAERVARKSRVPVLLFPLPNQKNNSKNNNETT